MEEQKMEFNLSLLEEKKREMTKLFLEKQGHKCGSKGILVEYRKISDGTLQVNYDGERVILSSEREGEYYRALHLFLQEIESMVGKPFLREEKCRFSETGIMLDCSRNGTLSISMMKEMIELCAAVGLNQLYLYMEDVYEIPQDPYFGAFRGRYTDKELRELDMYGMSMGVELIPAIQTLAHLHTYLRWPKTKKLQDTEDILLVGDKNTEEFVRWMIQNATKPFSSRKIHVGMDEADLLGLGRYLKINGYRERYQIMMEHLKMVHQICREEHLEGSIWSDMFFRLKSPTGDYYDLPEETVFELSEPLPEDLTLVYWDYYHHDEKIYDKNIKLHRKLTNRISFAGGGWTWNGIAPNYSKARKTLQEGLASCEKQKIDQVFCTFWFDNGMETPARTAIYSAVYFAQLCYYGEADTDKMDLWLKQLTGYKEEEFLLLDMFDSPKGVLEDNKNADNPSKYLLYQDVLIGLFDGQVEQMNLDVYYQELNEKLEKLSPRGSSMDEVFIYYRGLAQVLAKKSMMGVKLRKAYQNKQESELVQLKDEMESCLDMLWQLKEMRKKIWFNECKPFGYEVLDIRLGGVGTRMESAVQRLESYLKKEVDILEELEEKTLIYDEDTQCAEHTLCAGGFWQNMVSAGNISGI